MQIHFKSSHANDEEEKIFATATDFAERKIQTLKKFFPKNDEVAQVYVELGKSSEAHQQGNIWRVQINLDSYGKRYHADAVAEKIETAVDKAVSEISAELRKAKQKSRSMLKKGGGAVKSFLRGFGKT